MLDVRFHVTGRGLGLAIALMLTPLSGVMFSQRVDGATLYYRRWGVKHALSLIDVAAVTTSSANAGNSTLTLAAPGVARPLRVPLLLRGYAMPAEAREHLQGWLDRPGVQLSPAALALLRTGTLSGTGTLRGRKRRRILMAVWLLGPLIGLGAGNWLVFMAPARVDAGLAIPGAPGYFTASGPLGEPFPVERPWGVRCEPVLLTVNTEVPDGDYQQLATVVAEARGYGLDIALASRNFKWYPGTVSYPPGVTVKDVPEVPVLSDDKSVPRLPDGEPARIELSWDAKPDPDGRNEDVTCEQATLHLLALHDNARIERTVFRQIVAFTQGVGSTDLSGSGLNRDTTLDSFSAKDISAMKLMSGCG